MKPISDDRGRFCSFNTTCGRNCTPRERERCMWWKHDKDEPEQKPLDLVPPVSHAKLLTIAERIDMMNANRAAAGYPPLPGGTVDKNGN